MYEDQSSMADTEWIQREYSRLSRFLRQLRENRGLSSERASLLADLERKTYGRIESEKFMPRYSTLLLIAKSLNMSPAEFFRKLAGFLESQCAEPERTLIRRYHSDNREEVIELWRVSRPVKQRTQMGRKKA